MRALFFGVIVGGLLAFSGGAPWPARADGKGEIAWGHRLSTIAGENARWEVLLAPADVTQGAQSGRSVARLRLLVGTKEVGSAALTWPLSRGATRAFSVASEGQRWSLLSNGEEGDAIVIERLRLEPGVPAVLVQQSGGREALSESYQIFVFARGGLHQGWAHQAATGLPQHSWYEVRDVHGDDAVEVILYETWHLHAEREAGEQVADRWSAQVLSWDVKSQQVLAVPLASLDVAVHAAVFGSFGDIAQAMTAITAWPRNCAPEDHLVLEGSSFPQLDQQLVYVAFVTLDKAAAAAELRHVKACGLKGTLRRLIGR